MARKKRGRRKLTKAERRAIALRNLAKAHRGRRKSRKSGYKPRALSRRRFKKKRTGLKRFGRNRGEPVKVLTTGEKRRRRGRKRKSRGVKRSSRRRSTRRSGWTKAKRRAAGRKAARTRKRRKSERRTAARKGKRRSSRRSSGRRRTSGRRKKRSSPRKRRKSGSRSRRRKSTRYNERKYARRMASHRYGDDTPEYDERRRSRRRRKKKSAGRRSSKRSRAAKKAWRTRRERGHVHGGRGTRRRKSSRRRRRKNPIEVHGTLKRNPRRRHHRRHNPLFPILPNPMGDAGGFLAKASGFAIGFLLQDAIDRFGATHTLTADTSGNVTDTPAAGQIYDSESVQLPIWSSTTRLAYNAAGLAIPGILGRFFWADFWNHAFAAAVIRTLGKVATSAVAQFAPANATTLQLYGGEYAANARLQQAAGAALTQAQAGTFAGLPRGMRGRAPVRQLAAPPQRKLGDCGCGPTNAPLMVDPLASAADLINTPFGMQEDPCCFNPLTAGTGPTGPGDTFLQPVTPQPTTTLSPITPTPSNTVVTPTPSSGNCSPGTLASLFSSAINAIAAGNRTAYNGFAAQLQACGQSPPPWNTPIQQGTPTTVNNAPTSPAPTPTPAPSSPPTPNNRPR